MMALKKIIYAQKGQSLMELTMVLPILLILGLGVIEFSNVIDTFMVLTHLTREGANLTSRGGARTEADITASLTAVINAASPTIRGDNSSQWHVIYSQIRYDSALGACGDPLSSGFPDYYHVFRQDTWLRGGFTQSSKIGANGACAAVSGIKAMPPGQTLHVIEVFYDYRGPNSPNRLTPIESFVGSVLPSPFYTRSIFTDVTG